MANEAMSNIRVMIDGIEVTAAGLEALTSPASTFDYRHFALDTKKNLFSMWQRGLFKNPAKIAAVRLMAEEMGWIPPQIKLLPAAPTPTQEVTDQETVSVPF